MTACVAGANPFLSCRDLPHRMTSNRLLVYFEPIASLSRRPISGSSLGNAADESSRDNSSVFKPLQLVSVLQYPSSTSFLPP